MDVHALHLQQRQLRHIRQMHATWRCNWRNVHAGTSPSAVLWSAVRRCTWMEGSWRARHAAAADACGCIMQRSTEGVNSK
jgi:hypothetical protein